jgi:broad specificity phosphatase PhoE
VGARLARPGLTIDRVVAGALSRQRDTAEAIMTALGRPLSDLAVDDRLDEYDHVAVMARHDTGISFANATAEGERGRALQSALEEAIGRWISGGDGYGETHDTFVERVQGAIGDLVGKPGGTVAVTSGGVISAYCALSLGLPVERWPSLARLVVNASITKIISGRTGTSLVTFNDHAHLESERDLITYR